MEPSEPDYWPPAHRELALTLDDILLEHGELTPFARTQPSFTAMRRFGDVLLVNGETELDLFAQQGEVVRLFLTNTANAPVFNVERVATYINAEPEKILSFAVEMDLGASEPPVGTPVDFVCPMHPDVVQQAPGRCPECGMALVTASGSK